MRNVKKVQPYEFRRGKVQIDSKLIAAGERSALHDPDVFGKLWMKRIQREAEDKGLVFVDSCDKSGMIAEAAANDGLCNTISIGRSSSKPPVSPFANNFALCVAITNDICNNVNKAKDDPNGIVGTGPLRILVQEGIDSFWAQVLVSNCYPRANVAGACIKTEVPKLKDVLFALGDSVPHFANLVDGDDYKRCLEALEANPPPSLLNDDHMIVDGVTYESGVEYELHGLVSKPELNGQRVRVAKANTWRENAATHPGRVQVIIKRSKIVIFAKPSNLRPTAGSNYEEGIRDLATQSSNGQLCAARRPTPDDAIAANMQKCVHAAASQGAHPSDGPRFNPNLSKETIAEVTAMMASAYAAPGYFDPM